MAPTREFPRADRRRKRPTFGPDREELETRVVPAIVGLPSGPPAAAIAPLATASPAGGSHSPNAFTPSQIRAAYGFDRVLFGSVAGDGSGQTIAIVDAYDDPKFVNTTSADFAASDLAQFDRQFGLPDPPSFTKINQAGQTSSLPSTDPAGAGSPSGNWEDEEAMDVEWAHALAPGASIVLVEASSNNTGDLYSALNVAKALPGVSAVSLSWGGPEYANESFWDPNFQTPAGHQGVTFVAASGDGGAPGIYPAYAKDVVAVGGTALQLNADSTIQSETAWSGSGGGVSTQEPEPSYQQTAQSTGHRTLPDVSFVASYSTGVATYDSYNDTTGSGPWISMWGTSLGAPSWAALIAVANQGRVAAGGTTLDGFTQTLPALYAAPSADFHDITSGSNGAYSAGSGYDEVTGLGTPVANLLARDLAFFGMSDHLAITTQPASSMAAGQAFGLTVAVERPDGTIDAAATGSLTLSLATGPGGASLGGPLTAAIDHGVATFSGLSIQQVGSGYSLAASGGGLGSATSSTFAVAPAVATQLVVTAQPPSGVSAGSGFGLAVVAEDAFGNPVSGYTGAVSLALAGGPASGHLGGTVIVAASGGVASFPGLSIDQAGADYTIQATAPGLTPATTGPITVAAASPSQLVIEAGPPSSVTAGSSFGLTVAVEDAFGNLDAGYTGTVTVGLAGAPSGAVLGGPESATVSGGMVTFSGLIVTAAGPGYTLQVTATGLGAATTSTFLVTPAAASQLAMATQPPSSTTAGNRFGLTVAVEDAYGNPVATSSGRVALTLGGGPPGAGLVGTLDAPISGGVASFSGLSLDRAVSVYTIQVSSEGLASASTTPISVTPAAPSQLLIESGPPTNVTAGSGFGLTVAVEDAYGNLELGYRGAVTIGLLGGPDGAALGGPNTEPVTGGLATFSGLVLTAAGSGYQLQASGGDLAVVRSRDFGVTPAAPAQLAITRQPATTVAAGSSFGVGVEVEDVFGNLASTADNPVALQLLGGPPGVGLGGTTAVVAGGGVAAFDGLALDQVGSSYRIEATSPGLSAATTTVVSVTPAAPSHLVITLQPPAGVTAGAGFGLSVAVEDAFGNLMTGYGGAVTVSLEHGPAGTSLSGAPSQAASQGVATFSGLTLDRAGVDVLAVSADGLASLTTSPLNVVAAAPSQLVIVDQPPARAIAGQPFGFGIAAEDRYGNVATGFDGPVTAALAGNKRRDVLRGVLSVQASGGQATFTDAILDRPGKSYTITISSAGLTPTVTSVFDVIRPSRRTVATVRRASRFHHHGHRPTIGRPARTMHHGAGEHAEARVQGEGPARH